MEGCLLTFTHLCIPSFGLWRCLSSPVYAGHCFRHRVLRCTKGTWWCPPGALRTVAHLDLGRLWTWCCLSSLLNLTSLVYSQTLLSSSPSPSNLDSQKRVLKLMRESTGLLGIWDDELGRHLLLLSTSMDSWSTSPQPKSKHHSSQNLEQPICTGFVTDTEQSVDPLKG